MTSPESTTSHEGMRPSQEIHETTNVPLSLESVPMASNGILKALQGERFSLLEVFGGWRGILESSIPPCIYVIVYLSTKNLTWTLAASLGVGIVFLIARLLQKQDWTQAVSGLLGVGVSVLITQITGRGQDFFAPGIAMTVGYTLVFLVSIMVRRPLFALLLGWMWKCPELYSPGGPSPSKSQAGPADGVASCDEDELRAHVLRALWLRCRGVTWLWTAVFVLRIAVLAPLWFFAQIAALGVAKIALGLPLAGIAGWVSWMLLRPFSHLGKADEGSSESH